jgi:hypothetical protein
MTVTFSGLANKTHGNYCDLSISSCYGGGAAGVATAPGGCDGEEDSACAVVGSTGGKCDATPTYDPSDRGPLSGVLLTESGSGYARIGRVAPTITLSAETGIGATLTPTLAQIKDCQDCEVHYWAVQSISVSKGDGYENTTAITFATKQGDTTASAAAAVLLAPRGKPTVTAEPQGGKDGKLSLTTAQVGWGVGSIGVSGGGSNYTYGAAISVTLAADDVAVKPLSAIAKTTLVAPTLSLSVAGPGSGATLTPTLQQQSYPDGKPYWTVSAISVSAAGSGYKAGATVSVNVTDGKQDTDGAFSGSVSSLSGTGVAAVSICDGGKFHKETGQIASVFVAEPGDYYHKNKTGLPTAPTLTASAAGGSSAGLSVTLKASAWGVDAITVDSGGTEYRYGGKISFAGGDYVTEVTPSVATLRTTLAEPTISLSVCDRSGSGAIITPTLSATTDEDGRAYWYLSSAKITAAGINYLAGDVLTASVLVGETMTKSSFSASVGTANADTGAIQSITIADGGKYFLDTGVIASASITDYGRYYRRGVPSSVVLSASGKYYREDKTATSYTSPITVTPCGGSKDSTTASLSASVDDNAASATFGHITGLTVDNGGTDYLAWKWIDTCRSEWNDVPFVLRATNPIKLVTLSLESCYGSGAVVSVTPLGPRTEPELCIKGSGTDGTITPTVTKKTDDDGLEYWTISSVSASGGYGYTNDEAATVTFKPAATVDVAPSVTLQATGVTEEDPADATNDGVLTGATVVEGGKFYIQHEYDGTAGPIKKVSLDTKGSGYALLGRQQPTLTLEPQDDSLGVGAVFTPTFEKLQDGCGIDYWQIKSATATAGSCFGVSNRTVPTVTPLLAGGVGATVTFDLNNLTDKCGGDYWEFDSITVKGGYNYTNNSKVTVLLGGSTVEEAALGATLFTKRAEPTLSANSGSLSFDVTYANAGTEWSVASLAAQALPPCAGYTFGQSITLAPGNGDVTQEQGVAYIKTVVDKPILVASAGSGSGAAFTVSLAQQGDAYYGSVWAVSGITATTGGSGYTVGSPVSVTLTRGQAAVGSAFAASVSAVGSAGEVQSVAVANGGKFFWDTRKFSSAHVSAGGKYYKEGVTDYVTIANGGNYYTPPVADETVKITPTTANDKQIAAALITIQANKNGTIKGLTVVDRGHYYRENKALTPYVADVTVTINQTLPSAGSNAKITATVESDTNSGKFGQIKKLTIDNGGSGYQILGGPLDCTYYGPCGIGLEFRGKGKAADLTLDDAVFRTNQVLDDCNKLPTSASVLHGIGEGSVTIAAGGAWDDKVTCPCNASCTPCEAASPCKADECPPCTGKCDSCNPCQPGCGCEAGNCVACCGPCDEENPCPEGCSCCDGECVAETCCGPCDEENPCPEGCSCVNGECVPVSCSNECAYGDCVVSGEFYLLDGSKTTRPTAYKEYSSGSALWIDRGEFLFQANFQLRPEYLDVLQDAACSVFIQFDEVNEVREFPDINMVYQQTWQRGRLFLVSCDSGEMVDVSNTVSYGELTLEACLSGPPGGPSFSTPVANCPLSNPGFRGEQEPQLICPP